ncbi:MAG: hypothetical protein C4582_10715 [Desulfobacteraceae bacterium]|jgi:hypothetical protein|nr:MAG: hypothetical protein C4582_10715 [Desulfobacteraceae bacterium]
MAAFGALLTPEILDGDTLSAVKRMVRHETSRFNRDPPYSNSDKKDSKAEENAWNANVLVLAQAMMPNISDLKWVRRRASQWLASAYSRPSDLINQRSVDGRPIAQWLGGYNMFEDGYVYNHGRIHPDYIAAIELQLWNVLFLSVVRQEIPQAADWNVDVAYRCLVDYEWTSPPFKTPGGTIYVDGEAKVHYPQGTDWSPMRVDNFFALDVLVSVLGLDQKVSTKGDAWALLRADYMLKMQSREGTGQLFIPADQFNFAPKESFAALHFCYAYLALWLKQHDRISPIRNWLTPTQ